MWPRRPIPEALCSFRPEATHPLVDRLLRHSKRTSNCPDPLPFNNHSLNDCLSTVRCQPGILVYVHSISSDKTKVRLTSASKEPPPHTARGRVGIRERAPWPGV